MHLEGLLAFLPALQKVFLNGRLSGRGKECRHKIFACDDVVVDGARLDRAGPLSNHRYAEAAFERGALFAAERRVAAVRPGEGFRAVIAGKEPVAIQANIGRRPIASFGNSDGDLPMLLWTCQGEGERFCLYVHHTDAEREFAYDRKSEIGKLDAGLDEAKNRDWTVVDMKNDWKTIYLNEKNNFP